MKKRLFEILNVVKEHFKPVQSSESGMELSEYAVASALVVAAILVAITTLSDTITEIIQGAADLIGELMPF